MKFATILKSLLVLTAAALLTACGGGTSGGDSAFQPATLRISATPSAQNVPTWQSIDVSVRVTQANGSVVADGTTVAGVVSPASAGSLQASANGALGGANATTTAGIANYRFTAMGSTGNVALTFSVSDPAASTRTTSTTVNIAVVAGGTDPRLTLAAVRTQLPVNHFAVDPFLGSPYMAEVIVTVKDGNGQPVNLPDGIQVSINPVGNTGGFTTLDDPETTDVNEFLVRMGQAPVDVVAGKATLFVHALNSTGTTTLTVTTQDPVSTNTITTSLEFEIVDSTPPLPSRLGMAPTGGAVYVQGSGGNDSSALIIEVRDAIDQPVPDPVAGSNSYNNYRLEIVGANANESPRFNGVNAAGQTVSGPSVDLRTTAGLSTANFISGNGVGSFRVRLSADRADNNVDNGISDPVILERSIVVSDGQLFDLEITQPTVNALTVNPAGGEMIDFDDTQIPVAPDGTYSLTVGVIATDRLGNPVLPGTTIKFGLIDEPQTIYGSGDFYISGGDGNPQEGGTLFTAVGGHFQTAGGGVGPGDTLVVMGEHVIGNRDLESARTVTQVNSQTSLSVDYRFNHNDTTGQSVDYHGILPYIVGRAADGNIVVSATTNADGVATTKMNYPVSKLGKNVVIWAQADGPLVASQPKKVADVEFAYFAGVAPATLVVSPSVLSANSTTNVVACVYDALGGAMGNVPVGFAFEGLSGQGWVDGVAMAGTTANPTALGSGCTVAEVRTAGVLESDTETKLVFQAAGAEAEVTFSFNPLVLQANPTMLTHSGVVTLTLLNNNGVPQPGHQIVGECTGENGASIWLDPNPGVTDVNGRTTATIRVNNLDGLGQAGSGECTFKTVDDSASTKVKLQGQDLCLLYVSPLPSGCPSDPVDQHALSATLTGGGTPGSYSITSAPSGLLCTVASGTTSSCSPVEYDEGTTVTLTTTGPAGATFGGWTGDCVPVSGSPEKATVIMNDARSCVATWNP
ncbi:MAG TPA: hypothetical protein VFN29_12005 [Chiayiivirga sp.]|nr:hypothetical protein [Chiayiivirga sp.]